MQYGCQIRLACSILRAIMLPSIAASPSASPRGPQGLDLARSYCALQSNFNKQYAPTSAETKKAATQNHASALSSYLTHRVASTPLKRATMLAATSNSK